MTPAPVKKKDLVDGAYYEGSCRNSNLARWSAKKNKFFYLRTKFGSSFVESLPGPEDAIDGLDYFLPTKLVESPPYQIEVIS